jgi:four helix bundle protein
MQRLDSIKLKPVKSYKDLLVWQRAMGMVEDVYALTRQFPPSEAFGLCAQLRRAALSIPSNVAEGNGYRRGRDYIRLLVVARASSHEIETQLLIAERLKFASSSDTQRILARNAEIGRMLSGLIRSLSRLTPP